MPSNERPVLTEQSIRQVFGENMGIMTGAERVRTVNERETVDREQAKTGRPLMLTVK